MVKYTVWIYKFFQRHKVVFYTILIVSTLFLGYFTSKITFEEDISKLLPSAEEGAEKLVFSNLKVKDKIFILFNPLSDEITPDELIEVSDEFVQSLLEKDTVYYAIDNILSGIDEDLFQNAIAFLYDNAPMYLDSTDYVKLDNILSKGHVEEQMDNNYALLRSPVGSTFQDIITHDPIGLNTIFLSQIEGMGNGLGGNYAIYDNHIFSADTTVALAFLSPNFKSFDSKQGIILSEMIEAEIANFQEENPDIEILYHGAPVQSVYNSRRVKLDLLITISISLILIVVILLACFKNISTIPHLLCPVIYGVLFALAIVYFIKGSISLMALGIGAIVIGVAFSYCLHIITHYKYLNDAVKVLKDETNAVIFGTLTTIGAFVGLLLTNSELLQDFGLFASLGLVGTTAFALIFLPQFYRPDKNRKSERAFSFFERINSYPFEKKKWLVVLIVLLSIVCFIASDKVEFDSNLQNIGYNDARIMKSRDLLMSKTTGTQSTVYFSAIHADLDSALIMGGKLTNKLDQLKEKGEIKGYSAPFTLFIPAEEQEKRIALWNDYWTDDKKADVWKKVIDAGSKYNFSEKTFEPFLEMLDADYEPVSLYHSGVIPNGLLDNIIEYSGEAYLVFVPVQMDRAYLSEIGDEIVASNKNFLVIDPMYYTNDMVKVIHDDFNITLSISSIFVLMALFLSYRSGIIAFISFLPMGLSWYIMLGCMAIFGLKFNLINIVISTFVFGIGVDYSIFIMDGLLATYRTKKPLLMYHKTAVFLSAVILVIVVTSLLFAVHPAISSIGIATLIGMGATILIAYTLVPFLFSLVVTNRVAKGKDPISIINIFYNKKTPSRQIKNNYLYKGNGVELQLRKELFNTNNYTLLSVLLRNKKSVLDFGCGSGFVSYWTGIANKEIDVTGFDRDLDAVTLCENCYKKTKLMRFTSKKSVLQEQYDVVVFNKYEESIDAETIKPLIRSAEIVVIRKKIIEKYELFLTDLDFNVREEDKVFFAYIIKNK